MALSREQAQRFFDEELYLNNNEDVQDAVNEGDFDSGLTHFVQHGAAEGRAPSSFLADFDATQYLDTNPDVADAIDDDDGSIDSALEHFLAFGAAEGRSGTGLEFDSEAYLAANFDVQGEVDAGDVESALVHFLEFGQAEGRNPTPDSPDAPDSPGDADYGLTVGRDDLAGTSEDEVFNAPIQQAEDGSGAVTNTLESGDVLDGNEGNNVLNADLTATTTGDVPTGPSISSTTDNIQEIFIRNQFESTDAADNLLADSLESAPASVQELFLNLDFGNLDGINFGNLDGILEGEIPLAEIVTSTIEQGGIPFSLANDLLSNGTNIDAQNNNGVEQWWTEDSRADLLIEDIRERSDDVTFGMRDTDPGVSYAAFFDPASLTSDATDSSLTLTLTDVENPDSLDNFPVEGLRFSLNGEEFDVRIPRDEDEDGTVDVNSSYDDFVAALNEEIEATEGLENVQASLNQDNTITLEDAEGGTFEEGGFLFIDDEVPARGTLTFNQEVGAPIEGDIITDIVLDGAGRTAEGGVMVVGSMGARGGIEEFNVEVGNSSWLQALSSTNNTLETVNVSQLEGSNGSLYLGAGGQETDGRITADTDVSVFETVDDRLLNSGLVDVRTFNAEGFANELKVGAFLTEESFDKYLADAEEPVTFEYLLGDGGSNLSLLVNDTLSSDPDFELDIVGGAEDDRINLRGPTVKEAISVDGGEGENTLEVDTTTAPAVEAGSNFEEVQNIQRFVIAGNNFDPQANTNETTQNIEEGNLSGVEEIIIATEASFDTTGDGNPDTFLPADTTVSQFEADTDIIISGKNQTIGSGNSNDPQFFGTIAIEDAPDSELELILDNTARVDGTLQVDELNLEEDENVETLQLVSGGRRETENQVLNSVLPNVTTLELIGSQNLDIHVSSIATDDDTPLEIDGSELGEENEEGDIVQPATLTLALNGELLTEGSDDTLVGAEGDSDSLILYDDLDASPSVSEFETIQFGFGLDPDEPPFQGAATTEAQGTYNASATSGADLYNIENLDGDFTLQGLQTEVDVRINAGNANGDITLIAQSQAEGSEVNVEFDGDPAVSGWENGARNLAIQDYRTINLDFDSGTNNGYQYLFELDLLDEDGFRREDPPADFDEDEVFARTLNITGGDPDNEDDSVILADNDDVFDTPNDQSLLEPSVETIDISGFEGSFASGFNPELSNEGNDTTVIANSNNLAFNISSDDSIQDFNTEFVFTEDAFTEGVIWAIDNFQDATNTNSDQHSLIDLTALGITSFNGIQIQDSTDLQADLDQPGNDGEFSDAFLDIWSDFLGVGGVIITPDPLDSANFQIALPGINEADLNSENFVGNGF